MEVEKDITAENTNISTAVDGGSQCSIRQRDAQIRGGDNNIRIQLVLHSTTSGHIGRRQTRLRRFDEHLAVRTVVGVTDVLLAHRVLQIDMRSLFHHGFTHIHSLHYGAIELTKYIFITTVLWLADVLILVIEDVFLDSKNQHPSDNCRELVCGSLARWRTHCHHQSHSGTHICARHG